MHDIYARSGATSGTPFGGAATDSSGPPNCASVPVFAETGPGEELEGQRGSGARAGRKREILGATMVYVIVDDGVKKRRDGEERNEGRCLHHCRSASIPSVHPTRVG